MQYQEIFSFIFTLLILHLNLCARNAQALDCRGPPKTITVSQSGTANFKTVQSAVESVPSDNSQWIHIKISPGIIGAGSKSTSIEFDGLPPFNTPTFSTSGADNIIVEGITFKNTHNDPIQLEASPIRPAEAARIEGDKIAIFDCSFFGVQDTSGRHYYHNCYIQGAIDFIFGKGQSMFEESIIDYSVGKYGLKGLVGFLTAQKREAANETNGFVFKNCTITGKGKTFLGRGYGNFSRVIIADSLMEDVITPMGWNAWRGARHE
ncbi:hypothetical protein L6164_033192 [Bauhinia variegata]|uniref:Uncharacterized protein n=1 Tax=Bauhinia variegata TaxID=167791 RepID=A0ACB9KRP4_BAUVA|nr:hypothetical protein L6164_033192 [Bauhinia variegata]